MTLDEKLGEIVLTTWDGYENANAGVPRLCIPALTLQDGTQGLAFGDTNVTQLPAPLGIAASFNPSLARTYGQVEGSEARRQGIDVVQGLNLNIDRVPENGRSYETYGEDPRLVSAMAVADIQGIQSQGVLAQAKHFVAYSQKTNQGIANEVVSNRALQELYLPPFKAAVQKAYVSFPAAAGEPPRQLVAFRAVTLKPQQTKTVTLTVPASALAAYLHGRWTTMRGTDRFSVGESSTDIPLHASVRLA